MAEEFCGENSIARLFRVGDGFWFSLSFLASARACLFTSVWSRTISCPKLRTSLFFDFARTEVSPFLGGPMHYAHARGMIEVMRTLEQLAKNYDERVRPDQSWNQLK
jgi:hypothetical protein